MNNKHGLSRYIPVEVKREVRKRSKFGCVICRRGFYQYEHIDPPFEDAESHDPDNICCLCGACHDAVTRGQFSKGFVLQKYKSIQQKQLCDVEPPIGPLDFHDGTAELIVGGILYAPAVKTLLRYHGQDVIKVVPGSNDEPGSISAIFTDADGNPSLELRENEWIGSTDAWDIEVVGQRISVKRKEGELALQLRLEPPGRIVIEHLDMRYHDAHILMNERTYAVGRYFRGNKIVWVNALIEITRSTTNGVAFEFADITDIKKRDEPINRSRVELADGNREVVISSGAGILFKRFGIVIASQCGDFRLWGCCSGCHSLDAMREQLVKEPVQLRSFIPTSEIEYALDLEVPYGCIWFTDEDLLNSGE